LEAVLFAKIRFHDTVNRGRLLNRFGKDFEGIDSSLSDNLGRSIMYGLSGLTTFIVVSASGGLPFVAAALVLAFLYYQGKLPQYIERLSSSANANLFSSSWQGWETHGQHLIF
jgi:ABC-type multidrug transport system fused ATPase/permease subunit